MYQEMTREELIQVIEGMAVEIEKLKSAKGGGRKAEVLNLLKGGGKSIKEIANKLNISDKNVSSILSYLRADGHRIFSDENGRKILIEKGQKIEIDDRGKIKVVQGPDKTVGIKVVNLMSNLAFGG